MRATRKKTERKAATRWYEEVLIILGTQVHPIPRYWKETATSSKSRIFFL